MNSKDIIDTLKNRVRSYFVSTYVIVFIILNWKPIFVLFFSKKEAESRIEAIAAEYMSYSNILWLPLLITALYILVLPWVDYIIHKYHLLIKYEMEKNSLDKADELEREAMDKQSSRDRYDAELNLYIKTHELENLTRQIELAKRKLGYTDVLKDLNKKIKDAKESLSFSPEDLRELLTEDERNGIKEYMKFIDDERNKS